MTMFSLLKVFRVSRSTARWGLMVLFFWTLLTTDVLAAYRPPRNGSAPSSSSVSSSGVRRACLDEDGAMLLFAPRSHVGRTVSTRPSVSWFIPDNDPLEMELRLYELDSNGDRTLLEKTVLQTTPGIMQASVSETQPDLVPGNRYLWQVIVLCNPNRPSSALVDEAEMEILLPTTNITSAVAQVTTPQARSDVYAEAGLWYDALAQVAMVQTTEAAAYRQNLLQDLANLENTSQFGEQLAQIITP